MATLAGKKDRRHSRVFYKLCRGLDHAYDDQPCAEGEERCPESGEKDEDNGTCTNNQYGTRPATPRLILLTSYSDARHCTCGTHQRNPAFTFKHKVLWRRPTPRNSTNSYAIHHQQDNKGSFDNNSENWHQTRKMRRPFKYRCQNRQCLSSKERTRHTNKHQLTSLEENYMYAQMKDTHVPVNHPNVTLAEDGNAAFETHAHERNDRILGDSGNYSLPETIPLSESMEDLCLKVFIHRMLQSIEDNVRNDRRFSNNFGSPTNEQETGTGLSDTESNLCANKLEVDKETQHDDMIQIYTEDNVKEREDEYGFDSDLYIDQLLENIAQQTRDSEEVKSEEAKSRTIRTSAHTDIFEIKSPLIEAYSGRSASDVTIGLDSDLLTQIDPTEVEHCVWLRANQHEVIALTAADTSNDLIWEEIADDNDMSGIFGVFCNKSLTSVHADTRGEMTRT